MPLDHSVEQTIARGVSAFERDDHASALECFLEVIEDHPNFPDVRNKVGLCYAMLGQPEKALEHFDEALKLNARYAEAHLNRSIVLNDLGRFDEASDSFHRAGELDTRESPNFPADLGNRIAVAHAKLGDLYLVSDRPELAEEEYRKALDVRPRFVDIRSKLAEALIEKGRLREARDELLEILELKPHFTAARIKLGVALHRMGETEEAVREFERCIHEDPRDLRARAYLARVRGEHKPRPNPS